MSIGRSLFEEFVNSSLSLEGKLISNEFKFEISKNVKAENLNDIKHEIVLILEKDPLKLAMKFFYSLDNNVIPILLNSQLNQNQNQIKKMLEKNPHWHFWDSSLKKASIKKKSEYLDCYACMTSGTTGTPQLCFLSVENALTNARMHGQSLKLNEETQLIQSLPLYHSFGIVCYLFTLLEFNLHLDFNNFFLGLKSLKKRTFKNAFIYLSPSQVRFILKEKSEFPRGIIGISVGGGRISLDETKRLTEKAKKSDIYLTYGLTEAGPRVSTLLFNENFIEGSIGNVLENIEIAVLSPNNEISESGQGQLLIKSPCLKLNLHPHEFINEFLKTRDSVEVLSTKEIIFQSRESDIINIGGVTIYCSDIEDEIRDHTEVTEALVIPETNKLYGEVPILAIESKTITKEKAISYLKDKLSTIQFPKKILVLNTFPKTGLGKIDRKSIREKFYESKI